MSFETTSPHPAAVDLTVRRRGSVGSSCSCLTARTRAGQARGRAGDLNWSPASMRVEMCLSSVSSSIDGGAGTNDQSIRSTSALRRSSRVWYPTSASVVSRARETVSRSVPTASAMPTKSSGTHDWVGAARRRASATDSKPFKEHGQSRLQRASRSESTGVTRDAYRCDIWERVSRTRSPNAPAAPRRRARHGAQPGEQATSVQPCLYVRRGQVASVFRCVLPPEVAGWARAYSSVTTSDHLPDRARSSSAEN
jgi:hypothetical protein